MEPIVYIVRVILPDGKNKIVVEEEYEGDTYIVDATTKNLIIIRDGGIVIEFHTYNYVSIRPK